LQQDLLIGAGSQGTAALAVIMKLMRALVTKGAITEIEALAILDAAAESAERAQQPRELGQKYARSVSATIRQMMDTFPTQPGSDKKH
jgi:polyhydroxyalkanoate synthesis regulator phasin